MGSKKSEPTSIGPSHVARVKLQLRVPALCGDTLPSRDLLLFCLLADHGLRVSEVAALRRDHLDLSSGLLRFYRQKTDRRPRHRLTPDTLEAASHYIQLCALEEALFAGEAPGTSMAKSLDQCARRRAG